jgi:hypothetical protein
MKIRNLLEGAEPKLPGAPKGIQVMTPQQFVAKAGDMPDEEGVAEGLSKRDQQDVDAIKAAIERLQAQLNQPNADKEAIQQSIAHEKKRLELYPQDVAEDQLDEKWSQKYKSSINCSNPKGFSQKAHCAGKQKNESAILSGLKLHESK